MSVANDPAVLVSDGNGVTTTFNVPFVFASADLQVELFDVLGVPTTLVLGADYTHDPVAQQITLSVAPAAGEKLARSRVSPIIQPNDFAPLSQLPAETIEEGLDRLTLIAQELRAEFDRAVTISVVADAGDLPVLLANINSLALIETEIQTVASAATAVQTTADNIAAVIAAPAEAAAAAASAGAAAASAGAAAASEVAADMADDAAAASAALAERWATELEDIEVAGGKFSAFHWAEKASQLAAGSSDNISNQSGVAGATVTEALDALDAAVGGASSLEPGDMLASARDKEADGGWLRATGELASRTSHAALFAAIGKQFDPWVTARLSDPDQALAGNGEACAINNDATVYAYGSSAAPFIKVYSRTGDTLTTVAGPTVMPTGAPQRGAMAWSADGTHLVVGHAVSPFMTVYSVSGSTLTKLANPASLPGGTVTAVAISADGSVIAIGDGSTTPTIYTRSGSVLTKAAAVPTAFGSGVVKKVALNATGDRLCATSTNSGALPHLWSLDGAGSASFITTMPTGTGLNYPVWQPNGDLLLWRWTNAAVSTVLMQFSRDGALRGQVDVGTLDDAEHVAGDATGVFISVSFQNGAARLVRTASVFSGIPLLAALSPGAGSSRINTSEIRVDAGGVRRVGMATANTGLNRTIHFKQDDFPGQFTLPTEPGLFIKT